MPITVISLTPKVCDVCRILDKDFSAKPCFFCSLCDSWICEQDKNAWVRRMRAALKRKFEPAYKGIPDVEKLFEGVKDEN